MSKKLLHKCLSCGGTGWYNKSRNLGCYRCGGLGANSIGKKPGTGFDPLSTVLCITEEIFSDWIDLKIAVDKTVEYTEWTRDFTVKYLNDMYKRGQLVIKNNMAISSCIYQTIDDQAVSEELQYVREHGTRKDTSIQLDDDDYYNAYMDYREEEEYRRYNQLMDGLEESGCYTYRH